MSKIAPIFVLLLTLLTTAAYANDISITCNSSLVERFHLQPIGNSEYRITTDKPHPALTRFFNVENETWQIERRSDIDSRYQLRLKNVLGGEVGLKRVNISISKATRSGIANPEDFSLTQEVFYEIKLSSCEVHD